MQKIIFLILFSTCHIFAQNLELKNQQEPLKILSWNIYMLPAVTALSKEVGKTQKLQRTQGIVEYVKNEDFDIIVWQEIFNPFARKKLKRKLKELYPYQYGPANKAIFPKTNSGIAIFSKLPLKELAQLKFRTKKGIDAIANKGVLLMEGNWQGQTFQILGTHLQASGSDELRLDQMKQIKTLINEFEKDNIPQILCGDFNTRKGQTAYSKMIEVLDVPEYELQNTKGSTYRISENEKGSEIDYIFVKPNGVNTKSQQKMLIPEIEWGKNGEKWLSDHHAIQAVINFD